MAVWSEITLSSLGHGARVEAEYYRPIYLDIETKLKQASSVPLTRFIEYLTDGTHVTPNYVPQGIPFLSSSDINAFVISLAKGKFISEAEHQRLTHCQPMAGDLLIAKSGRIGTCAVVPSSIRKGDWNIYEGIALLRTRGVDRNYLAAFLNSKYGLLQIRRELKGVAQPHLHLEDLRRLSVFIPAPKEIENISSIVSEGVSLAQRSDMLYKQGISLLNSDIGT